MFPIPWSLFPGRLFAMAGSAIRNANIWKNVLTTGTGRSLSIKMDAEKYCLK
jgi:hypothetical protein